MVGKAGKTYLQSLAVIKVCLSAPTLTLGGLNLQAVTYVSVTEDMKSSVWQGLAS